MSSKHPFIIFLLLSLINSFATATTTPNHIFHNGERFSNNIAKSTIVAMDTTLKQSSECETLTELRLALAFDNTFCAYYGKTFGTALHMAVNTVSQAAVPLLSDMCIKLTLVVISGYCDRASDPFKSARGTPDRILVRFRSAWTVPNGVSKDEIDATYLMVGFKTTVSGNSINGAVGSDNAFGWIEKAHGLSLAHELGHLFSCPESMFGIMSNRLAALTVYGYPYQCESLIRAKAKDSLKKPRISELRVVGGSASKTCADLGDPNIYRRGDTSILVGGSLSYRITISQENSAFKVSFTGIKTKFLTLGFRLSTLSTLGPFEVGGVTRWEDGARTVTFTLPFKDVIVPEGRSSCCGAAAWLYMNTIYCEETFTTGSCNYTQMAKEKYIIPCNT